MIQRAKSRRRSDTIDQSLHISVFANKWVPEPNFSMTVSPSEIWFVGRSSTSPKYSIIAAPQIDPETIFQVEADLRGHK
jgi:hypothetical protein